MALTRIRPKKPHFFVPILPRSLLELVIPKAFRKYLVGENCEGGEALLRNHLSLHGKSWTVKLKGFCFQEGWTDFVRDNDLQIGDFLVFGYEGSMVFDVIAFDRSFLEKDYPPLHVTKKTQNKIDNLPAKRVMTRSTAEKAAKKSKFHRSFAVTIRKFNLRKTSLYIPHRFAESNGLMDKRYEAILRDEKRRAWPVILRRSPTDNRICISGGWLYFSRANHLKEDDVCVFKFTSQGKGGGRMVFDVKVFDHNDPRAAGEKKKHNQIDQPAPRRIRFFVTSLRLSNLKDSRLCVPIDVVRSNGLAGMMFETILRDGKGKSWQVKLKQKGTQTFIHGNWKEISAFNGLKIGDDFSLEIITHKGKMKPVEFRMH